MLFFPLFMSGTWSVGRCDIMLKMALIVTCCSDDVQLDHMGPKCSLYVVCNISVWEITGTNPASTRSHFSFFLHTSLYSPTCVRRYLVSHRATVLPQHTVGEVVTGKKRRGAKTWKSHRRIGEQLDFSSHKPYVNTVNVLKDTPTHTHKHFGHLSGDGSMRSTTELGSSLLVFLILQGCQRWNIILVLVLEALWWPLKTLFKRTTMEEHFTHFQGHYCLTACDGSQPTMQILSFCIWSVLGPLLKQHVLVGELGLDHRFHIYLVWQQVRLHVQFPGRKCCFEGIKCTLSGAVDLHLS